MNLCDILPSLHSRIMSVEIRVELGELLSRKACAVVIKHIIKFVAYNNQQIPYTYEGFQRLVTKKRNHVLEENAEVKKKLPLSFKQIKANNFYEKIEGIYDAFETTFKSIEEELIQGTKFKEVVIMLGATLVSPKHVYRIQIPELSTQEESDSKIRSHLFKIYRSIISSHGSAQLSGKCSGLTNIFILVSGDCKSTVKSGWFIPKLDFRIPSSTSQTLISFADPSEGTVSSCTCSGSDDPVHQLESCPYHDVCDELLERSKSHEAPAPYMWFLAKQALCGFQDLKIDGASVYNVLFGFES